MFGSCTLLFKFRDFQKYFFYTEFFIAFILKFWCNKIISSRINLMHLLYKNLMQLGIFAIKPGIFAWPDEFSHPSGLWHPVGPTQVWKHLHGLRQSGRYIWMNYQHEFVCIVKTWFKKIIKCPDISAACGYVQYRTPVFFHLVNNYDIFNYHM